MRIEDIGADHDQADAACTFGPATDFVTDGPAQTQADERHGESHKADGE